MQDVTVVGAQHDAAVSRSLGYDLGNFSVAGVFVGNQRGAFVRVAAHFFGKSEAAGFGVGGNGAAVVGAAQEQGVVAQGRHAAPGQVYGGDGRGAHFLGAGAAGGFIAQRFGLHGSALGLGLQQALHADVQFG